MRIGVNCFPLKAHIGGLKQQFTLLFDYLFEHDSANTYVLFHSSENEDELGNLSTPKWRKDSISLKSQEDIRHHISEIDLYFCPFGVLWPRPVPLPAVVSLADIQEQVYPEFFAEGDLLSRAHHFRGSTRCADAVVTLSEFSKSAISRTHRISSSRIFVSHLCADPRYFEADRIAPDLHPDLPFTDYMLFPANRWRHKNHDRLLLAMKLLKKRGMRANAVFTGFDVEGGYSLASHVCDYGLADQVHIAGYVSVPELAYLYRHARMLVFPSLFEGFGLPPIEAMAAGCPAVVSKATSLPEICGDAARYFDPESPEEIATAIEEVWSDSSVRELMIGRGRERARNFSQARLARNLLEAFNAASQSYSPIRYRWQRYIYQPFHRYRTQVRFWWRSRRRSANGAAFTVRFSSGWHEREDAGCHWIRWTSGRGRVVVTASRAMDLTVCGTAASLQESNGVRLLLNGKVVIDWALSPKFAFESLPPIGMRLRSGRNTIDFCSWKSGVSTEADTRLLAVAFQDLLFEEQGSGH